MTLANDTWGGNCLRILNAEPRMLFASYYVETITKNKMTFMIFSVSKEDIKIAESCAVNRRKGSKSTQMTL